MKGWLAGLMLIQVAWANDWVQVQPAGSSLELRLRVVGQGLQVEARHPGSVWIGVGFGSSMSGSDGVVGRLSEGRVEDVYIRGRSAESIVKDRLQNLQDASIGVEEGATVLRFYRPLNTGDPSDARLDPQRPLALIWAVGAGSSFEYHSARGLLSLDLTSGTAQEGVAPLLWKWLHGLLMAVSWGLLLPSGVLVARFYKVTRGQNYPQELDNRFWWVWHQVLQYSGIGLMTLGTLVAIMGVQQHLSTLHSWFGAGVVALGWLQVVGGWLRGSKGGPYDAQKRPLPPELWRGDHYDMTLRRRAFEALHKGGGYLALGLAIPTVLLGLGIVAAPLWAYGAYLAAQLALALLFLRLQRQGRQIDTYRAIWGPDPLHPGNKGREPIRSDDL